jgi:aspartyl-tRNA(Asn)/glutamyl-tRNA(Gln) amidotransferase subunit C
MSLELEQVHRIAALARIAIAGDEALAVRDQLNRILAMVETMQAVDTTGVEPMAHAQELSQRLREDRVSEVVRRDEFQALAPEAADGLYLVPKVIE